MTNQLLMFQRQQITKLEFPVCTCSNSGRESKPTQKHTKREHRTTRSTTGNAKKQMHRLKQLTNLSLDICRNRLDTGCKSLLHFFSRPEPKSPSSNFHNSNIETQYQKFQNPRCLHRTPQSVLETWDKFQNRVRLKDGV